MRWPIRQLRALIRQCAAQPSLLNTATKLHATIITTGLAASPNTCLRNALLHVYSSHGLTNYARKLFDEIPHSHKDTVDWSTLMTCLARHGNPKNGLVLCKEMMRENVMVDDLVMVCFFYGCSKLGEVSVGRQGHGCVVKMGFEDSVKVCNGLVDMYVKCGLLDEARTVFRGMRERSVISWTVILDGVVRMEGARRGRLVFDEMPERNEVAWTIMIAGYVGSGFSKEGFELLREMVFNWRFELNYVTLCSILSGCAQSGDVMMGQWVYVYVLKTMGKEVDVMVGTSLVDMYAKCGRIDAALRVFEYMPRRNVVSWNAVLSGLAMHGRGKDVLDMFSIMIKETKPDDLTFVSVLSACSHSGLVDQGRKFFQDLKSIYAVKPKIEHYACMVDLLGRAGHLEEAEVLIRTMPMPPNEVVLGSLLGSCSVYGKLELGERILKELVQIDPQNTEYHVLMSNMYALAGKKNMSMSIWQVLKKRGIRKAPGVSSIHVGGHVHQFVAGDKSHSQTQDIYVMLGEVIWRLKLAGYVPNTSSQVFASDDDVESSPDALEEKEWAIFSHSEKLALCLGLISTRPGTPLYIFKNLRTCRDCHSALKIASRIYNREIIVRDRYRFHNFKQGSCSCSDYW